MSQTTPGDRMTTTAYPTNIPVGSVTNVRYAVPGHYTTGPEFASFDEAVAHARTTIIKFDGIDGYSRAFVDLRRVIGIEHGSSDAVLIRWEVFTDRVAAESVRAEEFA